MYLISYPLFPQFPFFSLFPSGHRWDFPFGIYSIRIPSSYAPLIRGAGAVITFFLYLFFFHFLESFEKDAYEDWIRQAMRGCLKLPERGEAMVDITRQTHRWTDQRGWAGGMRTKQKTKWR
jgi:hypothetical protein